MGQVECLPIALQRGPGRREGFRLGLAQRRKLVQDPTVVLRDASGLVMLHNPPVDDGGVLVLRRQRLLEFLCRDQQPGRFGKLTLPL